MLSIQTLLPIALVGFLAYTIYKLIPPRNMMSIPTVPVIQNLVAVISGMPSDQRIEKYISPLLYEHGIAKMWLGRWIVLIEDVDQIKEIFVKTGLYLKEAADVRNPHGLGEKMFGQNIVFTSGDEWKKHRKVVNPAFHRKWSSVLINECIHSMISAIDKTGGITDVEPIFKNMALDGLGKVIFDVNFDASENPEGELVSLYTRAFDATRNALYFIFPILEKIPLKSRQQDWKDVQAFRDVLHGVMMDKRKQLRENRANGIEKAEDLLMMMVEAADTLDQDGNPILSTKELIDDAAVLFAAGHDTTSNTLAYTFFYLATNLDVQEKLRLEILEHIEPDNKSPTEEQCKDMVYLLAVIHESMRRNSTVQAIPRIISEDMQLKNGTHLLEDQALQCNFHSSMNNPKRWNEPQKFNPERFLTLDSETNKLVFDKTKTKAWYPFGGGSRLCVGMSFSLLEQKLILIAILRRYKVTLPKDSQHIDKVTGKPKVVTNNFGLSHPVDLVINFERL